MKRLFLAVALAAAISVTAHADEIAGAWTATFSAQHPDELQLSLQIDGEGRSGNDFLVSGFTGLSRSQIEADTRTPVEFRLEREAGSFTFEGTFRDGRGAGEFHFVADAKYPDRLRELGVPLDSGRRGKTWRLYELALFDVTTAFIRSMQAIGYDEPLNRYVEFRIFRVDPDYVHDMDKVGFGRLSAAKLVETRIHGVTPDYIREMRAHGEDLSLEDYVQSRIFRITPEFAQTMAKAGYPDLPRERLVEFRIHNVTPEFIADLRELGYSRLPASKLVEMRIHGVTPEFIRRVEKAGYHHVPVDKLVQMRIFDIQPEMVRKLDDDER